jgi:hydroxypyruvate isomerase
MPRFSANLSFLFLDRPFLDRFAAAAACGFKGVEFHFPYDFPADEVADAAQQAGVEVVLFNFPAGNWAAGERGIACLPERVAEFRYGVEKAARWPTRWGASGSTALPACVPTAFPRLCCGTP